MGLFSRRRTPVTDTNPNTTLTLRPVSATWIPLVVWATLAWLGIDALVRGGFPAFARFAPGLTFIAVLMWIVFWAPRLIVHKDSVEIRNILHTYSAPFTAIEHVGIGAMIRVEGRTESGTTRTVTAWNAPGVRRDAPWDSKSYGGEGAAGVSSPQARLVQDQRATPSYLLYERWNTVLDKKAARAGGIGEANRGDQDTDRGEHVANSEEHGANGDFWRVRSNWDAIALLVLSLAWLVVSAAL